MLKIVRLCAVLLIFSPLSILEFERIAVAQSSTTISWNSGSSGSISANGYFSYSSQYATLTYPTGSAPGALSYSITGLDGSNQNLEAESGTISGAPPPWNKTLLKYGSTSHFGTWYEDPVILACGSNRCVNIRFVPSTDVINTMLSVGEVATATVSTASGHSLSMRIERASNFEMTWKQEVELNNKNNPEYTVDPGLTTYGTNIGAEVTAKPSTTAQDPATYTFTVSAYEMLNGMARTEGNPPSNQTNRVFNSKTHKAYGANNLTAGVWYFSTDETSVVFEPSVMGLNSMNPGDSLETTIEIKLERTEGQTTVVLQTNRLTVQVSRPKIELSIEDGETTVVEGQTINIMVTSNFEPTGMVSLKYKPTNNPNSGSYNYLDETNGASGIDRTGDYVFTRVGTTEKFETTINVPTKQPNITDDGGSTITIMLVEGESYTVNSNSNEVEVNVLDSIAIPVISIRDNPSDINEGDDAVFTLESSPPANRLIDVNLQVVQSGDFVLYSSSSLRFNVGDTSKELRIQTIDDARDEENGSITVTILAGNETSMYEIGSSMSDSITINDDDPNPTDQTRQSIASIALQSILSGSTSSSPVALGASYNEYKVPQVSISSSRSVVEEGQWVDFRVYSNEPANAPLAVQLKINDPSSLIEGNLERTVVIEPNRTEAILAIQTMNDEMPDDVREMSVFIVANGEYSVTHQNRVFIRVTDNIDRKKYEQQLTEISSFVTPVILTAMGQRYLQANGSRMEAAFNGTNQSSINMAGYTSLKNMIVSSGTKLNRDDVNWMSVLENSSFSVSLFPEEEAPGTTTVWGMGEGGIVSGTGSQAIGDWNGKLSTAHLGFDTRVGDVFLLGLSTSMSETEIELDDSDTNLSNYVSQFNGIHPYLSYSSIDENFQLQLTTGYAEGEVGIGHTKHDKNFMESGIRFAGIDGVSELYSDIGHEGGFELDLTGQTFMARQYVKDDRGIASGLRANTTNFQLAVNAKREELLDIGTVEPSISLGIHGQRRNQHSLTGTEIATGFNFNNLNGLMFSATNQTFLTDTTNVEKLNLKSRLIYDQRPDATGYHLSVLTEWQRWLPSQSHFGDNDFAFDHDTRLGAIQYQGLHVDSEFEYGVGIWDGTSILTPGIGMNLVHDRAVNYKIGSRLDYGKNIKIELAGSQESAKNNGSDHQLRLTGHYQW